jgi:hypothetical protein
MSGMLFVMKYLDYGEGIYIGFSIAMESGCRVLAQNSFHLL